MSLQIYTEQASPAITFSSQPATTVTFADQTSAATIFSDQSATTLTFADQTSPTITFTEKSPTHVGSFYGVGYYDLEFYQGLVGDFIMGRR